MAVLTEFKGLGEISYANSNRTSLRMNHSKRIGGHGIIGSPDSRMVLMYGRHFEVDTLLMDRTLLILKHSLLP